MVIVASSGTQRGFTSLEMIIVSALFAPVVFTLCLLVETMERAYSSGERKADLQQSARIGMARIAGDLRAAGLDPSAVIPRLSTPAAIQTAESTRIAFIGDADGDSSSEKIEYRIDLSSDPPVLRRQQWSTWRDGWSGTNGAQPLAERITSVEFTYFGADGSAIPPAERPRRMGEIRRVGIVITAAAPSSQNPHETYRLVSEIRLRNAGL